MCVIYFCVCINLFLPRILLIKLDFPAPASPVIAMFTLTCRQLFSFSLKNLSVSETPWCRTYCWISSRNLLANHPISMVMTQTETCKRKFHHCVNWSRLTTKIGRRSAMRAVVFLLLVMLSRSIILITWPIRCPRNSGFLHVHEYTYITRRYGIVHFGVVVLDSL